MKTTPCVMGITAVFVIMTTFCCSVFGQPLSVTNRIIDKQDVVRALQSDFELTSRSGLFSGFSRKQAEPYLIQILDDYADAASTDEPLKKLQNAFAPSVVHSFSQADALFSHLLTWLARPANAEALIGVDKILLQTKSPQWRNVCLLYLEKIETQRLCLPLTNALSRLEHYFLHASPATPVIRVLMACALAQNGSDAGKELLLAIVNDEKADCWLQIECAKALLFLEPRNTAARAAVNRLLNDDKVPEVSKGRIMEVLYAIGDSDGKTWMESLIRSTNAMQRIYAAEVLSRKGDIRGIEIAKSLANESQDIVQARAKLLIRRCILGSPEEAPDIRLVKWNQDLQMFETTE